MESSLNKKCLRNTNNSTLRDKYWEREGIYYSMLTNFNIEEFAINETWVGDCRFRCLDKNFKFIVILGYQGASHPSILTFNCIAQSVSTFSLMKLKLKFFRIFIFGFVNIQNFMKNKTCGVNFCNSEHWYKPALWSCEVPHKFGLDQFSRFDVFG